MKYLMIFALMFSLMPIGTPEVMAGRRHGRSCYSQSTPCYSQPECEQPCHEQQCYHSPCQPLPCYNPPVQPPYHPHPPRPTPPNGPGVLQMSNGFGHPHTSHHSGFGYSPCYSTVVYAPCCYPVVCVPCIPQYPHVPPYNPRVPPYTPHVPPQHPPVPPQAPGVPDGTGLKNQSKIKVPKKKADPSKKLPNDKGVSQLEPFSFEVVAMLAAQVPALTSTLQTDTNGLTFVSKRDYSLAPAPLRVSVNPALSTKHYGHAYSAYWGGDYRSALASLELAVNASDQNARVWYYKGFAELKLGLNKDAMISLGHAIRLHMNDESQKTEIFTALERVQGQFRFQLHSALQQAKALKNAPSSPLLEMVNN